MSLVQYSGSSDEESGGEEEQVPNGLKVKGVPSSSGSFCSSNSRSLPSLSATKSSSGKIQILAPSFGDLESSSDEEDQVRPKLRPAPSKSGSRLSSILPPARSSGFDKTTTSLIPSVIRSNKRFEPSTTSLIPNSVKRTSTSTVTATMIKKSRLDDDEEEEIDSAETESDDVYDKVLASSSFTLPSVNLTPDVDTRQHPVVHEVPSTSFSPSPLVQPSQQLSDTQLKKVIAQKFGDEMTNADKIQLLDVNVNEHMTMNTEYLKTVSVEQDTRPEGPTPNPTVRRKHHITYLAHQAKQRELALKNEWAANRATRQASRAKYGW